MEEEQTIIVTSTTVGCDGGGGPLGHPKVYLKCGEDGEFVCPYCSRRFQLDENAPQAAGH